ncbi:DUF1002 domain-containing protein [Streptococcus mutans]|uniref:DUF1002 domain-containing protein n=1 Tax=Streptococcus mutans TaxID=1309 RepID=UPI001897C216|nr:DUF1002 domain-containing protein [Streptococcus mutans]MCB4948302.1 DUF1002 domain-containing protein [Streptococcus mutans]MCB4959435.1 DUF1002 domain-containing protein [Streptococcus mutans]MCB5077285.1 DUF1002 domain-containing protein [Streptococcus mutans]MCB5127063.1 DUF1002 domain-containing protein [Streptococcus mutans]MCB5128807.1 DUF1002 domain-containing protein [Streptococcus mutans]
MILRKLLIGAILFLTSIVPLSFVAASSNDSVQKVIDESYVQPDYVMGYSLSEEQRSQTLNLLGYSADKDINVKTLNTSSYAKIMNVADDPSLQLYSSVKIQKLGNKETLDVQIVTPENITKVTQDMYRNAAVTLGIEHAKITVAAPIAVTGESALAGIYYSLEENGASVSEESKNLAQEELNALSGINEENKGKESYDADKLNVALTDIKSAVADSGDKLTKDQVRKIVENTLKNYNLNSSMTDKQITLIVNFAFKLSKSEVIHNKGFKSTLNSLKDSIVANAKSTFKGLNLKFNANKAIESGKGFFAKIWQWLVNFFTGLFS